MVKNVKIIIEIDGFKKIFRCDQYVMFLKNFCSEDKVDVIANVSDKLELSLMMLPLIEHLNSDCLVSQI